MPNSVKKDLLLQEISSISSVAWYAEDKQLERCYYRTLNLVEKIYSRDSRHATDLQEARRELDISLRNDGSEENPILDSFRNKIGGILDATYEDLEVGLIGNLEAEISGAVIGDFIMLAKLYLEEGQKDVAAVLASAAFEDAIKRKATALNLVVDDKELHEITSALIKERIIRGPQTSFVEGHRKLRNAAMHANWDKVEAANVSNLINFLESFLVENF